MVSSTENSPYEALSIIITLSLKLEVPTLSHWFIKCLPTEYFLCAGHGEDMGIQEEQNRQSPCSHWIWEERDTNIKPVRGAGRSWGKHLCKRDVEREGQMWFCMGEAPRSLWWGEISAKSGRKRWYQLWGYRGWSFQSLRKGLLCLAKYEIVFVFIWFPKQMVSCDLIM